MAFLTVTKQYTDGTVLTESQLDAAFQSIMTFLNVTGINSDNIQDGSITAAELQSDSVTETKIAANSVTTAKIADANVTRAKAAADLLAFLVPTGTIHAYTGAAAPTGFLLCNGAAVSRVTYATLFAVIGVKYGSGNGSSTFNVPDARGLFLRGWNNGSGRDPDAGSRTAAATGGATGDNIGSYQADQFANHSHAVGADNSATGSAGSARTGASVNTAFPTNASGGNETRPKNLYVNYIIKI